MRPTIKLNQNNYLDITDKYGKIENKTILIVAESGYGKGLAGESIVEAFHDMGYVIIVLADPKKVVEYGFAQFLPKEKYHLTDLKSYGKTPKARKVKLYHPFTFRIPRKMIPDYKFYTLSLKEMGKQEWGMLAESLWEKDTVKLLINATELIERKDGLHNFLHLIYEMTSGKKDGNKFKKDKRLFNLPISAGTVKGIQDIVNYLMPFKKDYFLASDDCPLNLNLDEVYNDQEHYHVFVSHMLSQNNEKLHSFLVMALFNKFIENQEKIKKPILFVIPEVRFLTPYKPQGFEFFLGKAIKENLSRMRAMGSGMSALLDTQVYRKVDEEITDSATITLFGQLGGLGDLDAVCKKRLYSREIRNQLALMEFRNSYFMKGNEDIGTFGIWFPSHMHHEPDYKFHDIFAKTYPERMIDPNPTLNLMKKFVKEDEDRMNQKIKLIEERERKRLEELKKSKEESRTENIRMVEKVQKLEKVQESNTEEKKRLLYELKIKEPDITWRELGRKFNISHKTAKTYFMEKKEKMETPDETEEKIE